MPNRTVRASATALPAEGQTFNTTEDLASAFIRALRGAGNRPYVDNRGIFFIEISTHAPTAPEPVHHLGPDRVYFLGFDDRPFDALLKHPDYIAKLIAAAKAEGG